MQQGHTMGPNVSQWVPSRIADQGSLQVDIRAEIEKATSEICQARFGSHLRALLLTGSVAREETSIAVDDDCLRLLSDAELIGILDEQSKLPTDAEARELAKRVEEELANRAIRCHVSLGFAHDRFLRNMRPHIFAYELRTCGRVVLGDPRILSLIPSFGPEDIPIEDGWRLLSNRMVEIAEALSKGKPDVPSAEVCYRTIKLYLDTATSLLIFTGRYAASYRQRSENIRLLRATAIDIPDFDLRDFSTIVGLCTAEKLDSSQPSTVIKDRQSVVKGCQYAIKLWVWELQKMTGAADDSGLRLCLRFARQQGFLARVRGWLFVLRRRRWARSWRNWLRWMRLALVGSPRYCTYAAMGELFLSGQLLSPQSVAENVRSDWADLYRLLPEEPEDVRESPYTASSLGLAIGWNYHKFLEETRA